MPNFLYRYRNDLYKLVVMKSYQAEKPGTKGEAKYRYRDGRVERIDVEPDYSMFWDSGFWDDKKDGSNIRRAARSIQDYALCNDWQYFGTFTLNPKYQNRSDLDLFRKRFLQFIRNERRRTGSEISYILVPELHKNHDGWHMHGLLSGIKPDMLREFTLHERLPTYLHGKISSGSKVYDWPGYRERFGWVDMEPVKNRDAAARYISKYITKGGDDTAAAIEKGKHLYYVSSGLARPERIEYDESTSGISEIPNALPVGLVAGRSYDGDYCHVQWFELPRE